MFRWLGWVLLCSAAGFFAAACSGGVCVTVLDDCRNPADGGITGPRPLPDSGNVDGANVDAGFSGCIRLGCESACAGLAEPAQVCLFPECLACQRGDAGIQGAVFCGRLYPCVADAGQIPDAAAAEDAAAEIDASVGDAGTPDASEVTDASTSDAGSLPDAAGLLDAAVQDAAAVEDASSLDAALEDAATPDANQQDAGGATDASILDATTLEDASSVDAAGMDAG